MIKTEGKYNNEQETSSYHLDAIAAVNEYGEDVFLESLQEMKSLQTVLVINSFWLGIMQRIVLLHTRSPIQHIFR